MVFSEKKSHKNHDYWACFGSLQGKKSPFQAIFGGLCAKRNKLRVFEPENGFEEGSKDLGVTEDVLKDIIPKGG
jgi:hypothetical protein